jgi:hypothetical protein
MHKKSIKKTLNPDEIIDELIHNVSSKQIYRKFRNQECRKNGNNNAELFISEIG